MGVAPHLVIFAKGLSELEDERVRLGKAAWTRAVRVQIPHPFIPSLITDWIKDELG